MPTNPASYQDPLCDHSAKTAETETNRLSNSLSPLISSLFGCVVHVLFATFFSASTAIVPMHTCVKRQQHKPWPARAITVYSPLAFPSHFNFHQYRRANEASEQNEQTKRANETSEESKRNERTKRTNETSEQGE